MVRSWEYLVEELSAVLWLWLSGLSSAVWGHLFKKGANVWVWKGLFNCIGPVASVAGPIVSFAHLLDLRIALRSHIITPVSSHLLRGELRLVFSPLG